MAVWVMALAMLLAVGSHAQMKLDVEAGDRYVVSVNGNTWLNSSKRPQTETGKRESARIRRSNWAVVSIR